MVDGWPSTPPCGRPVTVLLRLRTVFACVKLPVGSAVLMHGVLALNGVCR